MNLCTFSGRLTRDAETRLAQSGTAITSFSIAVDTGFGEYKRTDFINCKFFKRENLGQHLTKGKPIIISGELQTEKWTDKNGVEKSGFSIICRDVDFQVGDKRPDGQAPTTSQAGAQPAPYNADDDLDGAPF